jgi:hypothetical protein
MAVKNIFDPLNLSGRIHRIRARRPGFEPRKGLILGHFGTKTVWKCLHFPTHLHRMVLTYKQEHLCVLPFRFSRMLSIYLRRDCSIIRITSPLGWHSYRTSSKFHHVRFGAHTCDCRNHCLQGPVVVIPFGFASVSENFAASIHLFFCLKWKQQVTPKRQ